tara:strand:- start:52753 stop:53118 length:366 start_codon:yes stop_codon:yes gene_type:complete
MKNILLLFTFLLLTFSAKSQTCSELMKSIKSNYYGTTYNSYTSEAISKVTFYEVPIDYQTHYFAIVCFKREYSYGCSEYLYQVGSSRKLYYSLNYMSSAGKAFWKYIQPYNENLGCAPNFD